MASYTPKKYAMKIGVTKEVLNNMDRRVMKNGFKNRTDLLYFALMNYLKEESHEESVNNEVAVMEYKKSKQHKSE